VNMDVQAIDPGNNAVPAATSAPPPPVSGQHAPPAPGLPAAQKPHAPDETLHRALSHLVGGGSNVSVQFRVAHGPNQIVTVFKNADTGEVISEFPSESMVLIAQFFNKLAGAVLDRTA
jgi:hypothetical protein